MHLADLAWTLAVIVLIVGYFMILFWAVVDVFRRGDLRGRAKAAWFVALLVLPLVALIVYVGARGTARALSS